MRSYDDIILGRIDEAEMCLENEWFIAALTLALTLPDICGKAEYPDETVTARYIQWFNTYANNRPIKALFLLLKLLYSIERGTF